MDKSPILIEVSVGELLDKISILEIKSVEIKDHIKINNIKRELDALIKVKNGIDLRDKRAEELYNKLKEVNENLWKIEDQLRDHERSRNFDEEFILLARKVYHQNDLRSSLKKQINLLTNSYIQEEKSYQEY